MLITFEHICLYCGKAFINHRKTSQYCDRHCWNMRSHIIKTCPVCHQDFKAYQCNHRKGRAIYCSATCRIKAQKQDPIKRFNSKVNKTDSCWIWTGFVQSNGYGKFQYEHKGVIAHRFAYEITNGTIPDGLVIDHLCRNPACVNPSHLEAVTQQVNILRGYGLASRNSRVTHCKNGHPFDEQNTYYAKNGRACRVCRVEWSKQAYLRLKSKRILSAIV